MLSFAVPGRGDLSLEHVLLDLNGTLTRRGELIPGTSERIRELCSQLDVVVLSADTFGALAQVASRLGVSCRRVGDGADKERIVCELGGERCVAIGNGANDRPMLAAAAIGIAVVGPEGAATETIAAADVVCSSIVDALDLLLEPRALVATLRL